MKQEHNEGFSLIEVLVGIVLLGVFVVPTCAGLVMSHSINAKTDAVMQAQLAVSSAVETLMAEGIVDNQITTDKDYWIKEIEVDNEENAVDDGENVVDEEKNVIDCFPDVKIKVEKVTVENNNGTVDVKPYYKVTITDNDDLVSVETVVRAAPPASEEEGGQST